jgi:hypothetical protein
MLGKPESRGGAAVLGIGLLWLGAAIVVGGSGRLQALRPPAPQLVVLGLALALLLAGTFVAAFRDWAWRADLRLLVALHLARFVGFYFLVLYRRGELPYAFAVPGGWGDILVATGALGLLISGADARRTGAHRAYVVWNLLGLLDILFVVATATRLALADPASMAALLRLPLSLLPTFLVPLIIASHVLIALRLATPGSEVQPHEAA